MQVVTPLDIEDCLRRDLAAHMTNGRVMAQPVPPDLKSGDVIVYSTGGGRVSASTNVYDLSIDVYALDDAEACELARTVSGVFSSLPVRDTVTQYSEASANIPYQNFDNRAPSLARWTFSGRVICPGENIDF